MPESPPVYRCLCFPHTFAQLKQLAAVQGMVTVEQITEQTGCGSGCGLCRPYLELMLATGETAFAVLPATTGEKQN